MFTEHKAARKCNYPFDCAWRLAKIVELPLHLRLNIDRNIPCQQRRKAVVEGGCCATS